MKSNKSIEFSKIPKTLIHILFFPSILWKSFSCTGNSISLVAKLDNIDISDFVLKTKYNTGKAKLEKKIPDTSGLVEKTNYNTKITE